MPSAFTDLTNAQKNVVKAQEQDRILQECVNGYGAGIVPAFIVGTANESAWRDLNDKCIRQGVTAIYFLVAVGRTAALRTAITNEAAARVQAALYLTPGERVLDPVVGEDTGV